MFWFRFVSFVSGCLVLLPLTIWDMLRITRRLAEPLYRFEQVMKEFEATGVVPETKLRYHDLLENFCVRLYSFALVMHERYWE